MDWQRPIQMKLTQVFAGLVQPLKETDNLWIFSLVYFYKGLFCVQISQKVVSDCKSLFKYLGLL